MSYNTSRIIDFLAGPNLNLTEFWQYYLSNSELGKIELDKEINSLLPSSLVATEEDRRSLLILALGSDSSILRNLNFSGAVDKFCPLMIEKLKEDGKSESGKEALWALLEVVYTKVGDEKKPLIMSLKPKVYKELAGKTSKEKANFLINQLQPREALCSLIFYLNNYWFDGSHGNPAILINTLHKDLFFAAQELWNSNKHEQAQQILEKLAEYHSAFGQEWSEVKEIVEFLISQGKDFDAVMDHLIKCRKLYKDAISDIQTHQLIKARQKFVELNAFQPHYPNISVRIQKLKDENENQVYRLQKIIDAAQAGFIYDEHLPWGEQGYPYQIGRALGIKPDSTIDEINTILSSNPKISPEQPTGLEQLQKEEQRLFTDVFLYPFCPSEKTALSIVDNFLETGYWPLPEEIIREYGSEGAMLLLLMEKPQQAADYWREQLRNQPLEGKWSHCLGLFYLGQTYADPDRASENWQRAISHWAMAMADTVYWTVWGRGRSKQYGRDFTFAYITDLSSKIQDRLESLITEQSSELLITLKVEFQAVRLSKALGGISFGEGKLAWFGPLWMSQYGFEEALSRHLASVVPDQSMMNPSLGEVSPEAALCYLRCLFSPLQTAAVQLLDLKPNPDLAIDALEKSDYKQAIKDEGDYTAYTAYYKFGSPRRRIREDALYLEIEAHFRLARAQIKNARILNSTILAKEWQTLLNLAQQTNHPASIRERLRKTVLDETILANIDKGGLDAAIELLQFSLGKLTPEKIEEQLLKNQLADLLGNRGAYRLEQDIVGAEADWRWALTLNPHFHAVRVQLANLWLAQANLVVYSDRFLALDYVRRTDELIKEGQQYLGYEYASLLETLAKFRENLIGQSSSSMTSSVAAPENWQLPPIGDISEANKFYSQGIQDMREGKPDVALARFASALELVSNDSEIQTAAANALLATAWKLNNEGKQQEGLEQVRQWMIRLPMQTQRLQRQLEFLERWPDIQLCLKANEKLVYEVQDYKEIIIPFGGKNVDTVPVYARIEAADLCLTAPLPPLLESEMETSLSNLLRASRRICLFKFACDEKMNFFIKGLVPFSQLSNDWFLLAVYEISDFADIAREQMIKFDKLQEWFREMRATRTKVFSENYHDLTRVLIEKFGNKSNYRVNCTSSENCTISGPFGSVEMEAAKDGIHLATRLGSLRKADSRKTALTELARLNATQASKLSLDTNDNNLIWLSVEKPYFKDDSAVTEGFNLLIEQRKDLLTKLQPYLMERGHG
ncbi:MAG: hypothetical protein U1F76_19770 [Candidatus Competibacteraceae bacterium]